MNDIKVLLIYPMLPPQMISSLLGLGIFKLNIYSKTISIIMDLIWTAKAGEKAILYFCSKAICSHIANVQLFGINLFP